MQKAVPFLFALLLIMGCDPIDRMDYNDYHRSGYYPQPKGLVTNVGFIAIEWNNKLKLDRFGNLNEGGYGSGLLLSKQKGYFLTAKHVSDAFGRHGRDWARLLINGRAHKIQLIRVLRARDMSVVKIVGENSLPHLPEPPPLTDRKAAIGDRIFIEGHHPHPYQIRMRDKLRGINYPLIPIIKDYYGQAFEDEERYLEIVDEKIPARVVAVDVPLSLEKDRGWFSGNYEYGTNLYIKIETGWDHLFSFGGLSGTIAKNAAGEVIGNVTAEYQDEKETVDGYTKKEYKIIYITPIISVYSEIREYADNVK